MAHSSGQHVQPAGVRHLQIGEDQIGPEPLLVDERDGLPPVARLDGLATLARQRPPEEPAQRGVVLDHQDAPPAAQRLDRHCAIRDVDRSSTSLTFADSESGVNGFCKKAVSGRSNPSATAAWSVYPDMNSTLRRGKKVRAAAAVCAPVIPVITMSMSSRSISPLRRAISDKPLSPFGASNTV